MATNNEENCIREFLQNIDCLDQLSPWIENFNLFDILGISRTEIRHSNILAWLLNSNENHGLGNKFAKSILRPYIQEIDDYKLALSDFYSFSVYREWKNIDILMVSEKEKTVIAIENKVGTLEHDNQLSRYKKILDNEYKGFKQILIYLTPNGEEPEQDEDKLNWKILSYETIFQALKKVQSISSMSPEAELLIKNYMDTIRRNVLTDTKLNEICNEIYKNYKTALDLIYKYKTSYVTETINTVLENFAKEHKIIYQKSNSAGKFSFYTKEMTEYLPDLPQDISSWGNKHTYAYELYIEQDEKNNNKLRLIFVLAPLNAKDQEDKMLKILNYEFKKQKNLNGKWNTVKTMKKDYDDNDSETGIQVVLKNMLEEMLNWQNELLKELQK